MKLYCTVIVYTNGIIINTKIIEHITTNKCTNNRKSDLILTKTNWKFVTHIVECNMNTYYSNGIENLNPCENISQMETCNVKPFTIYACIKNENNQPLKTIGIYDSFTSIPKELLESNKIFVIKTTTEKNFEESLYSEQIYFIVL